MIQPDETIQIRVHGKSSLPTLIYLPGLHGDWTLVSAFRAEVAGRLRFVEITYPRTVNWMVVDYANAVELALRDQAIDCGWLLAESWGSQVAWSLLDASRTPPVRLMASDSSFQTKGLILAGGFVKHPIAWGPALLRWLGQKSSSPSHQRQVRCFVRYARFRHGPRPEVLSSLAEFAARRTEPDRRAIQWRLQLLDNFDPRPIARRTLRPVHYLAGLFDPLVPWFLVRWWLRQHCPGYRGGRTFWRADHNVLATAATPAARQVERWMAADAVTVPGKLETEAH